MLFSLWFYPPGVGVFLVFFFCPLLLFRVRTCQVQGECREAFHLCDNDRGNVKRYHFDTKKSYTGNSKVYILLIFDFEPFWIIAGVHGVR